MLCKAAYREYNHSAVSTQSIVPVLKKLLGESEKHGEGEVDLQCGIMTFRLVDFCLGDSIISPCSCVIDGGASIVDIICPSQEPR